MSTETDLTDEWREELDALINDMRELGDKPDILRYELLSTEALRLSRCITDLINIIPKG